MIAIVDQQFRDMANAASSLSKAQNKVIIAGVEEFLMPIDSKAIVQALLHKKSLMNDIPHTAETQDVIIVERFLSPIDFHSLAVNVHNISKKTVPLRMCF